MDSSVQESRKYKGMYIVSSTDFFFPNVEDPELMGRIACANVLSDLYAMGIVHIDSLLMILASSLDMPPPVRTIVTRSFIQGFSAHSALANVDVSPRIQLLDPDSSSITVSSSSSSSFSPSALPTPAPAHSSLLSGGQSILNPWPIIGGTATTLALERDILFPTHAQPGDVLVLTKPLGTQVAVNMKQWSHAPDSDKYTRLQRHIDPPVTRYDVLYAFHRAQDSMLRLNRGAAQLMIKYGAHAATDVTGFGLLGHADALLKNQRRDDVDFVLHTLPCIRRTMEVAQLAGMNLRNGLGAETSGGLLVVLPRDAAESYMRELVKLEQWPCWMVGEVVGAGSRVARLVEDVQVVEV